MCVGYEERSLGLTRAAAPDPPTRDLSVTNPVPRDKQNIRIHAPLRGAEPRRFCLHLVRLRARRFASRAAPKQQLGQVSVGREAFEHIEIAGQQRRLGAQDQIDRPVPPFEGQKPRDLGF